MSHVESASSHNPAPDTGPPVSGVPDAQLVALLRKRLAIKEQIIENLHRILGQKRTTIKELRAVLADERRRR